MKLFHASSVVIERPDVFHSREKLDFGKGFYLTTLYEQADKYVRRFLFPDFDNGTPKSKFGWK